MNKYKTIDNKLDEIKGGWHKHPVASCILGVTAEGMVGYFDGSTIGGIKGALSGVKDYCH